jgi:DNA-directed RNA polymerase II subunit RPB1
MSAQQDRPAIGLIMDSVSGAYMMTHPHVMVDPVLFGDCLSMLTNNDGTASLFKRAVKYGVPAYSGRTLFSSVLPPDLYYKKGDDKTGVLIVEGILIRGLITKAHVGPVHRSIVQELWKGYGSDRTVEFLTDATWIIQRWLDRHGFTVGIGDCAKLKVVVKQRFNPITHRIEEYEEEINEVDELVNLEVTKMRIQIEALGGPVEDPLEEEYRRGQIKTIADIAKGVGIKLTKEFMAKDNNIGTMVLSGAKGAEYNVGQIGAVVGPQYYRGDFPPATLTEGTRRLPVFEEGDLSPEAFGFINHSYYQGLAPEELFLLLYGGREGIMNTALKTAETGALYRRMIKAFENMAVQYDGSVRNVDGTVIQFLYYDGFDAGEEVRVNAKGYTNLATFIDLESTINKLNIQAGWVPEGLLAKEPLPLPTREILVPAIVPAREELSPKGKEEATD